MNEINRFTHLVEDVLDDIRGAGSSVTPELVDVLLAAVDFVKAMLEARSNREVYEDDDISSVADRLRGCVGIASQRPAAAAAVEPAQIESAANAEETRREAAGQDAGVVTAVRVSFDESNPMNSVGGIQVFAALKEIATVLRTDPDFDALYSDDFSPVVTYYVATDADAATIERTTTLPDVTTGVTVSAVTDERPDRKEPDAEPDAGEHEEHGETPVDGREVEPSARSIRRASTPSSSVLRVDSRRVDNLLNLVSEAVINKTAFNQLDGEFADALAGFAAAEEGYRSSLRELFDATPLCLERMHHGASAREIKRAITERFGRLYGHFEQPGAAYRQSVAKFRGIAQSLGRITGELQEGVMRIRMVPIAQIFSRFPRLVRDLTRSLNKDVALPVEGEETELDKSVIEDLLDPLIHCVRNSIDHGIESPDERVRHGKPETGDLLLRASSEGNMIVIEVSDDGRGIDVDAVRRKAVDRGVIHPGKALSDVEAYNLIFDPGFSSAREVSAISGGGVGLDVVRRQIEKLNGTVTVGSELHRGTTFRIRIPLTLAIIQGLMVNVGQETYAIPITAVLESQRTKSSEIRRLDNSEVLNVRDDVVSLLRLNRIFRVDTDQTRENLFVVIVGSGDKKVGLVVDSLIGEEDVVIKPLRDRYTNAPGIAGANITGDGRVSLVTFSLGGKDYGVDIMKVAEIAKYDRYTCVPNTPAFVSGVYNLRGDIISLIDMRVLFNLPVPQRDAGEPEEGLILRLDRGLIGVIVDRIDQVVGIASRLIQPPHPIFADVNLRSISGVVEHESRLYIILDMERILGDVPEVPPEAPPQQRSEDDDEIATGTAAESGETAEFVAETLRSLSGFVMTDLNRAWVGERLRSWSDAHSGRVEITTEAEVEDFLRPFYSPYTGTLWDSDYLDAVRALLPSEPGGNVHAWNPGCGSGYESYSIACLLRSSYPDARVKVWAADTDLLGISMAPGLTLDPAGFPGSMNLLPSKPTGCTPSGPVSGRSCRRFRRAISLSSGMCCRIC